MNPDGTRITGMIAVCSVAHENVRFDYEINLAQDKVVYHVRGTAGELTAMSYAQARATFDAWCKELGSEVTK